MTGRHARTVRFRHVLRALWRYSAKIRKAITAALVTALGHIAAQLASGGVERSDLAVAAGLGLGAGLAVYKVRNA